MTLQVHTCMNLKDADVYLPNCFKNYPHQLFKIQTLSSITLVISECLYF
jgi:hypothetical protein